jgi:hypothetical protein
MKKQYQILNLLTILICYSISFADSNTGLWMGQIEVNKVNEVVSKTDTQTPSDVKYPFDMNILLHVDASGKVSLLRHVTLMQKIEDGGTARRVLITDDSLLPEYEGIVRKDGKLVGMRMGSLGFEFEPEKNSLELSGILAAGQSLEGQMTLSDNHPVNPFKHMYHPDHKNGIIIVRNIVLNIDKNQLSNDPEKSTFNLTGSYNETITGLHKIPLKVQGVFNLQRISEIDTLNE